MVGDGGRKASIRQRVRLGDGARVEHDDWNVAAETAVEIDVNGVPLTVTMATPDALEELAIGLVFTEGVVRDVTQIHNVVVDNFVDGVVVNVQVAEQAVNEQARRSRLLEARAGCGLCGVETLAIAMRNPILQKSQRGAPRITDAALQRAFQALPTHQPLNKLTHSVHVAAWCTLAGEIIAAREDVGRHNALDKLVGWLLGSRENSRESDQSGFVLMSSRLSFELVCKAAAMGASLLAAVSAPTSLALELAANAELPLVCLGPHDSIARFDP
jgi:FdhD protein